MEVKNWLRKKNKKVKMTRECCRCDRWVREGIKTEQCESCEYWYCDSCASPDNGLIECLDCHSKVCVIDYIVEFGICVDCEEKKRWKK